MKKTTFTIVLSGLTLCSWSQAFGQCGDRATLTDYDRKMFVGAVYGQGYEVTAEFLATEGCEGRVLASLRAQGAKVKYSDEKVGYTLVTLPKDKILETLDTPGIADATVTRIRGDEEIVPIVERKIAPLPSIEIPFPQVATSLAENGPYFAAAEAGLSTLWKRHPEADGRGVGVAVVDAGIDLLHPALQRAKDKDGHLIPKVADIEVIAATDESANWVQFGDPIQAAHGALAAAGQTWSVPTDALYRFGIYERKLVLGPEGNSHTKKLSIAVGVLWNEERGRVWVDADGDGSFKNETALSDYGLTQDIGFFGRKDGENDNRIPFGVKIDRDKHAVYVAVTNGGHGTFVSGPLAANRLTGGLFDGAAPNAQLVDVVFGGTKVESALRAMSRTDVDVVNHSGGVARYIDNGKEVFDRLALERAVTVYNKPFVAFSAGANLFLVNDYVSGEMLRRNRQASPPYLEALNSFVWFKPEGLVNSILAPSGSLVTQSRYMPHELQWKDGRRHTYQDDAFSSPAPAGYGIGSNESPTIPVVTGVLADLISEARREHVRYTTARLYQALMTSARIVPDFPLSVQGHGLVNAAAAWDQLGKMATADDPSNPALTSFMLARKEDGKSKEVNGYSEEFSGVGQTAERELWITRQGGYGGGRNYRLGLRGNDGTFGLLDHKATLIQGKPARVRFKAKVRSKWHVAFLQLIDVRADVVMEEIPLSVQGPDVPKIVAPHVEKYQATMPPRRSDREYVHLEKDVQAARFAMRIPYEGPEPTSGRYMPGFSNSRDARAPAGEPVDASHHVGPIESFETLFANTKPGTREVVWENRDFHAEYETPYDPPAPDVSITGTLTVAKYAVAIDQSERQSVNVTNKLADVEGKVEIYDAKLDSSQLKGAGAHASLDVLRTLRGRLSQWRVAVSSDSLPENSADAFLLNCTDTKNGCFVAAQGSVGKASVTLIVDEPKEGDWRIVVRTRDRKSKAVEYKIRESILTPSATAIETADAKHASGTTWSVALPPKQSDAQYVAFHIAGSPGKEDTQNDGASNGVRIALTALDPDAP